MSAETQDNNVMIELVKVSKVYPPDVVALQDVSLSVAKGEIVFLTGMSGAGKTTLLKLLCCLERPNKGLIEVAGQDLSRLKPHEIQGLRRQMGVAYQDFRILPRQTVAQNIAMAMEVTYQNPKAIRQRVAELLEALKIADKRDTPADKLSRGEQQRVALARAAATKPPLILADEPTGNLDPTISQLVVRLFEQLNAAGTTLVIATHDEAIYRDSPHRVVEMRFGRLHEPAMPPIANEP